MNAGHLLSDIPSLYDTLLHEYGAIEASKTPMSYGIPAAPKVFVLQPLKTVAYVRALNQHAGTLNYDLPGGGEMLRKLQSFDAKVLSALAEASKHHVQRLGRRRVNNWLTKIFLSVTAVLGLLKAVQEVFDADVPGFWARLPDDLVTWLILFTLALLLGAAFGALSLSTRIRHAQRLDEILAIATAFSGST